MKALRFWALLGVIMVVIVMLTSCATVAAPQTLDQRLAYAYGSVTATRYSCADAVQRERIDKTAGTQCLLLTDHARRTVDAARMLMIAGDPNSAQAQIELATGLLLEVEKMLKAQVQP